ncbi:MAG: hypothetical protein ACU88J_08280, partial [Gammaproteobacteria bacterium]
MSFRNAELHIQSRHVTVCKVALYGVFAPEYTISYGCKKIAELIYVKIKIGIRIGFLFQGEMPP